MAELQRSLHHSLAELVRWSDNFLLHSNDPSKASESTTATAQNDCDAVFKVVENVRNAVKVI